MILVHVMTQFSTSETDLQELSEKTFSNESGNEKSGPDASPWSCG